jgi:hypothetical protein
MLIQENIVLPRARCRIHHERAYDFDPKTGLYVYRTVDEDEEVLNLITDAGRVRLHTFCYNTASRTNGLNYIALTDDGAAPAAGDTTLASELTADGLARAQGTVTLPTGSGNQTTIEKLFAYVGVASQGVQKTALFDTVGPPPAGVMAHEIIFTQRTLFTNDTLTCTFTLTVG